MNRGSGEKMNRRIVIVKSFARYLCDYLNSKGVLPIEARDGAQALALVEKQEFDVVFWTS